MCSVHYIAAELQRYAVRPGNYVLRSGAPSRFYFDKFALLGRPGLLQQTAEHLAGLLPQFSAVHNIAGVELGAVPLVIAVALHTGRSALIVRKEAKLYGGSREVEGPYSVGNRVVLIEDVLTTGASALKAAQRLTGNGLSVAKIIALVRRADDPGVVGMLAERGYPTQVLLTMNERGELAPC